jgi:hypothetical protein
MRLYLAWKKAQTPVVLPLALTCVGVVSLVLGDHASKAFSNIGGSVIIRVMGAAMVIGGALILSSIINYSALREVVGLALAAFGAAIYGGGVVLGLAEQGLVSGIGYTGITLTLLGRLGFILRAAKTADRISST